MASSNGSLAFEIKIENNSRFYGTVALFTYIHIYTRACTKFSCFFKFSDVYALNIMFHVLFLFPVSAKFAQLYFCLDNSSCSYPAECCIKVAGSITTEWPLTQL
jgi:hypothetical protein